MEMKDPDWLILGTPRPVQIEALRRSYCGFRAQDRRDALPVPERMRDGPAARWGHWLQMRLGKTPVAFAEFALYERDHGIRNLLVVSPNTYKQDWANEASRFGVGVPVHVFETSASEEADAFVAKNQSGWMVVMNHEAMQHGRAIQFVQRALSSSRVMLVLDEAIRFKSPSANSSKWMIALSKEATVFRSLTGLPLTQGAADLYNQLAMLGATGNRVYHAFRNRYCDMGGFRGKAVKGAKNTEELRLTIEKVAFDAKRLYWADRINAAQSMLRVELLPEQLKHYKTMTEEFYAYLEGSEAEVNAMMVVTKLMKLQQITSGFIIDEFGVVHEIVPPEKVPKIRRLIELIEDEIDGKIVVPYFYKASGVALERALAKYNPAVIHSQQTMLARGLDVVSQKARFNNDPSCRVAVVQISASKYGHDLSGCPGDRTSFMAFYEGTYSLDDREQIEARITASTQDWPVNYLDFVSSEVERRPIEALQRKVDIVEAVLGERGRPKFNLGT